MKKYNTGTFIKNILPDSIPWHVARRLPPAALLRQWPELMGAYLAERALPICLEPNGLLLLAVRGAALRQELSLNSSQIIDKLNAAGFNVYALKTITARLADTPADNNWSPPELSAAEKEEISRQVAAVQNPELRQTLTSILTANWRVDKTQA